MQTYSGFQAKENCANAYYFGRKDFRKKKEVYFGKKMKEDMGKKIEEDVSKYTLVVQFIRA
ncbi:MAG: hypothetical protein GY866_31700 [Proteobacteria bacterium]|nr:hypothetical protein [Pseudomonadota bacterium]